jgi:hypothetical protein
LYSPTDGRALFDWETILRSAPDDDGALMPSLPSMISTNNESIPQPTRELARSGRRQRPLASNNLNLNQLTPEEEKMVSTWCEESHAVDSHTQMVEIAQQLQPLDLGIFYVEKAEAIDDYEGNQDVRRIWENSKSE